MTARKGHLTDKHVLVVEDHPANLKLTREILRLLGCRISEVCKAEDAFRVIEEENPNLVLMDIQLPGMDGLTATRILREEMGLKDLPVIGVSAMAREGDREKAFEAGCCEYITKPIDTRKFMELLRHFLTNKKYQPASDVHRKGNPVDRRRILVVDDNPTNVKLLKTILPEDKYEILEAFDGVAAVDTAFTRLPDLIFLDIMLPDLDGYEVMKLLKENADTSHIPVILVTALEDTSEKVRGLEAGAEEVLIKPVNRAEVLARTRSMIRLGDLRKQVTLREQAAGLLHQDQEDGKEFQGFPVFRILVVEDSAEDLDLIRAYLEKEPYEIVTAGTGRHALDILRANKVDLIVLDIQLPDMGGFEVLERAKNMNGCKTVQTIITTCLTDLESKIKSVELGADDYLVKPVNSRELKTRLRALLKKKVYMDKLKQDYIEGSNAAIMDPATGVHNRDFFMQFMELELKRSRRHSYSTSLLKILVDDTGLPAGDSDGAATDGVLRKMASILKRVLREIDLVARYEEAGLAVLLPYCEESGAAKVVTRMREALTDSSVLLVNDLNRSAVSLTFSVVTFPGEVQTAEQMAALVKERVGKDSACGKTRNNMAIPGKGTLLSGRG